MTALILILVLSAMAVVGVVLVIRTELAQAAQLHLFEEQAEALRQQNRAERVRLQVEHEIDDLWVTLWADRAEAEGLLSPRPHDQ